jgi:hypothetical protein
MDRASMKWAIATPHPLTNMIAEASDFWPDMRVFLVGMVSVCPAFGVIWGHLGSFGGSVGAEACMGHPVGKLVMGQLAVDAAQDAFGGARALIGSVDFLVNQFNAIGIKQGFFGAGLGTKDQGSKGVKHRDLRYDLSQVLALRLGNEMALRFLSSVNLGGNLLIPCQVVDASVFLVLFLNIVHKLNILKMNSAHVLF